MEYDFETWQNRASQGSAKWNAMLELKPDVSPDTVPLSVADMEFLLAPEIRDGLCEHLGTAVLGYTQPTPYYFECIQQWLARRQDLQIETEWIVPTPGVVNGIGLALTACTNPGDGIIVMTPVYYPFYKLIEYTGRRQISLPLTDTDGYYTIDVQKLDELASDAAAILLCSPHNPVGRVWTKQELEDIGEIASKYGLLIISDEIHGDLVMPGYRHIPFLNACPDMKERTVLFTAPSKTFNLAGMQASSAIIPNKELRAAFEDAKMRSGQFALNALAYTSTELAYTRCDGWYKEMIEVIDGNRQLAIDFIQREIPQAVVSPLQGTYLLWVDLRYLGLDPTELEKRMIAQDLFFDEGYVFGNEGAGFERINLAVPRAVLVSALDRLKAAVDQ
ncbi:MAG: pyridoxal phosphate-dependent aminotransferase [Clostridia bacterium]|nr:pyridoxal phosphate-dependent aminotransferase [Clostridia bacterium]